MARLTADQRAAIVAGQPVEQDWTVSTPRASGSSTFDDTTLHSDTGGPYRVIDAGQYTVEGYNVSMAEPGRLTSGLYRFTVDNGDGYLSPESTTNVWYNSSGTYQAMPVECKLTHRLRIKELDGTWTELLSYIGQVQDVQFNEAQGTAVVECKSLTAVALEAIWTDEDGVEQDTGLNVIV